MSSTFYFILYTVGILKCDDHSIFMKTLKKKIGVIFLSADLQQTFFAITCQNKEKKSLSLKPELQRKWLKEKYTQVILISRTHK